MKEIKTKINPEIRALFHKLWTKSVGTKDYVKDEWQELANLLRKEGIELQ